MIGNALIQVGLYFLLLIAVTVPLGAYMTRARLVSEASGGVSGKPALRRPARPGGWSQTAATPSS